MLTFIFQLSINHLVTVDSTHVSLQPEAVHFGDLPRTDDGQIASQAFYDPATWVKLKDLIAPNVRPPHYIWYKLRIPQGDRKDPVLFFNAMDSVQVYAGGEKLFQSGQMEGPSNRFLGKAPYFVGLPDHSIGGDVFIGVYSDRMPGLYNVFYDEQVHLKDFILKKDLENSLFSLLLLFIGFLALLLYARNRNEHAILYLALHSFGVFMSDVSQSDLHQELFPYPLLFNVLNVISLPIIGWSLLRLFHTLLRDFRGKKRMFILMETIFVSISALFVGLELLNMGIMMIYPMLTLIMFVYMFLYGVLIGNEYRRHRSSDMVLFATGYLVAFLFSILELSKQLVNITRLEATWPQYWKLIDLTMNFNYAAWGLLVFIIYIGLGVVIRIQSRLRAYAHELELKNAALEETNIAYSRFVPKQFLSHLEKDNIIDVKLGDHSIRTMTVLFSDIRSFTAISEKLTPEENFQFINGYLSVMEPVINRFGGFIDKYIGDAIMALFDGDPDDAVQASLAMLKELEKFNDRRRKEQLEPIKIGIGLNTGQLILGTVGGVNRMDGTVISDSVNLASRIESLTKEYGSRLLISDSTYLGLKHPEQFQIRELELVRVRGKLKESMIYEVSG